LSRSITLDRLFRTLRENLAFDAGWPDGNWPVRWDFRPVGFEIAVGAILTQNTRWENVEAVLQGLAKASLTNPAAILAAGESLEGAVRPAGFFRRKSVTLRRLAELWQNAGGRVPSRTELLELAGIGPETADAICLYAANRPEFIADAYTRRLMVRLGLLGADEATYERVKAYFQDRLDPDVVRYRALHALIVQHGKRFCRKRPVCEECPLRCECPTSRTAGG
jgi:endonuclease III related protein